MEHMARIRMINDRISCGKVSTGSIRITVVARLYGAIGIMTHCLIIRYGPMSLLNHYGEG